MGRLDYSNVLLVDPQHDALILTRSETHPKHPLEADLPGGVLDNDETHEQAIVREVLEETGIVISTDDLIKVYQGKGEHIWQDQAVFIVHLAQTRPDVTLSSEHVAFEWMPIAKVPHIPGSIQGKIEKIVRSGFFEN